MRYRDSDELCLPARAPEHAAPVRFLKRRRSPGRPRVAGRIRRATRQVLHFFITAVAWATGLGLVIGSIVLIATATGPEHAVPPASPSGRGDQNTLPQLTPRTPAEYRVLAAFSGHGDRKTAEFSVKGSRQWQLRWTYRCAPKAAAAQFTLLRADMGPGHPTIRRTTEDFARRGRGSEWLRATGHHHYLEVISACSWRVKVLQAF
jgi:hypothetical protein